MKIDSMKYSGKCSCGREHQMVTRAAVIEAGCLEKLENYMEEFDIRGRRCVLYDQNTYRATEGMHPAAEQEIILNPENLHANEIAVAQVLEELEEKAEVILAVGSGTIHDVARFCAYERGLRFVAVPTAASVDGFCSTVAAMTWHGFKKTLPAVAPEIVLADIAIIKKAPPELVKSGVGDILAKYTALADWKIAHVVTGEYFCPKICRMMQEAVDTVAASVEGILAGEEKAYEHITYALIISGLAMQMMGNSRPASGSEHHISHLIEMQPQMLPIAFPALHGEKTGVGAVLAAGEYHRIAQIQDMKPYLVSYKPVERKELEGFFGSVLAGQVAEENKEDCLRKVTVEQFAACWEEIRSIIAEIPSRERLYGILARLGAKRELKDIGVDDRWLPQLLDWSPLVRNRLTLMRMRRMIKE